MTGLYLLATAETRGPFANPSKKRKLILLTDDAIARHPKAATEIVLNVESRVSFVPHACRHRRGCRRARNHHYHHYDHP
jgi:hypothetical protein